MVLSSLLIIISLITSVGYVNASTTGILNDTGVRLRKGPGTSYAIITTLSLGTPMQVNGSTNASNSGCDGNTWYQVITGSYSGYICAAYVNVTITNSNTTATTDYEKQLANAGFPASYWPYLTALHKAHPSWIFKAQNTGLDFSTVVSRESNLGVSLIQGNEGYRSTESGSYDYYSNTWRALDGSNWYAANSQTVGYYLDPRNWLSESNVFQFEDLTYNSSYHTKDMVKNILNPTNLKKYDANYADYFMKAASNYNISPIYLASRVRQEVGSSTAVISGADFSYNSKSYSALYNPYNIGATSGADNWKKGLVWANGGESGSEKSYLRPWKTLGTGILGGANYIASRYVGNNQYTTYLQRFNVANGLGSVASHQYMTNIAAPSSESKTTYSTYNSYGILNTSFVFSIPVYSNMPSSTSLPNTGNPNNFLSSLKVNGNSVSNFNGNNTSYSVDVASNTTSVNISASKVVGTGSIKGTGNIALTGNITNINVVVTAENGSTKTYTVKVNKMSSPTPSNPTTNVTDVATITKNAGYNVSNNYITNINIGTSASSLMSNISNKGGSASVTNSNGNSKTSTLATGDKVIVKNGNSSSTYTVIVYGDANGDGKVSAVDYVKIKNYIISTSGLSSSYKDAADVNKDGKVSSVDYVNVKNYILGKSSVLR